MALHNHSHSQSHTNWNFIYRWGAFSTALVLIGIICDILISSLVGGNPNSVPVTASGRFNQFHISPLLGLYNLDFLNVIIQIFMIPAYVAMYAALRKVNTGQALLSLVIFLVGTTVFISGNSALEMLELSKKYYAVKTLEQQQMLFAAGEMLLAKGSHGSMSVFIGFLLPLIAGILMSLLMLESKVFSRATAITGLTGSILMMIYLLLITFLPVTRTAALIMAIPGGLFSMAWMILFSIRLLELATHKSSKLN
jgi:hypothetical protein